MRRAFERQVGPERDPLSDRAVAFNHAVMHSLSRTIEGIGASSGTFKFPTLVYRTAQGVRVSSGNPKDLGAVALEVASQPDKANLKPAGLRIVRDKVRIVPAPRLKNFRNNGGDATRVHAFPDVDAPVVEEVSPRRTLPMAGIVEGAPWIALYPWARVHRDARGWCGRGADGAS